MSSTKLLGQKRNIFFSQSDEDEDEEYENEINLPKISLHYTIEETDSLDLNEIKQSWNQTYKISQKLRLGNEKYKVVKSFASNLQNFTSYKKYYSNKKFIANNDLLSQEKEYISHCLEMKNYSINQIININNSKNIQFQKFNIILDIDSTMIKSVELNEINFKKKDGDIQIKGQINFNTYFNLYCRYRPYLFHFIEAIKPFFNFFISTLGHTNYASKIIDDFKQKTNINIPKRNIIASNSDKLCKSIYEIDFLANNEKELNNTIIIDDIVNFWIKPYNIQKSEKDIEQCIKCLIPSKRYIINTPNNNDKQKYGILIHNNIFEKKYNNKSNYSIDVDFQYCIEKDSDSEKTKCGQFYYLTKFVKKCVEYSLFSGIPLVNAMDYYRKKIFEDFKFNLKYLGNEWNFCIPNIIKELGGSIAISIEETTHFIIENRIDMKKIIKPKNNQIFINISYIFQCYFNLNRMNQYEKQFKINDSN